MNELKKISLLPIFSILIVLLAFAFHFFYQPKGFFADEFDYMPENYEFHLNNPARLPLVPFLVSVFGWKLFEVFTWIFALSGVFALARNAFEDKERAWFSLAIVGTTYFFAFYSARVLTDVFVAGCFWWSAFFLRLFLQDVTKPRFNAFLLFSFLIVGILSKVTFVAFFPLAAIAALNFKNNYWFFGVFGIGFFVALNFVGWPGVGDGAIERYALPTLAFCVLFILNSPNTVSRFIFYFLLLFNAILFLVFAGQSNSNFLQFERAAQAVDFKGNVVSDLPNYLRFYLKEKPNVVVLGGVANEDYARVFKQYFAVDFVVVHDLSQYTSGRFQEFDAPLKANQSLRMVYSEPRFKVYEVQRS